MAAGRGCNVSSNPPWWLQSQTDVGPYRVHLIHMDPKRCWFGGHSRCLIFGLMLIFSPIRSSGESCKSRNISAEFQHCGIHPDGVHQLDCFGKYKRHYACMWNPGRHTPKSTYTLIIKQWISDTQAYCSGHYNITELNQRVKIFPNRNVKVEVFENAETTNCTKAVFRGPANSLLRCEPPNKVSFSRLAGKLKVNVSWKPDDNNLINYFSVRYKEPGSLSWNESHLKSFNRSKLRAENLNWSLVYVVQIRCVTSAECSQCLWSEEYTVPSELRTPPIINSFKDADIPEKPGRRLISLTWKFPAKELHDGYFVTIWKASGEAPQERIKTLQPEIRLVLSYSAYQLNISAANNVSISPPVSYTIPQREDFTDVDDGRLNVTVHNSKCFTIYWRENLIKKYVCYMVEWSTKAGPVCYQSFYETTNNYKDLSSSLEIASDWCLTGGSFKDLNTLKMPSCKGGIGFVEYFPPGSIQVGELEPYKRYSITLHTRPNKETCNMKHINNSESTYGTTQFYLLEGTPVSAPANISFHNETVKSVVLQWSTIPEEQIRGFLLGYVIHYTEYNYRETSTENNITVAPWFNSYKLEDLKSETAYQFQISAFTSAGAGVRSAASFFKTNQDGSFNLTSLIIAFSIVVTVLVFGTPIIKRAKATLWPSIPNPGNSIAVQKIDGPGQLKLLEAAATLKVEEWDTKSLHILEKEDVSPAGTSPAMLPLLKAAEDLQDSPNTTCNWIQTDTDSTTGDNPLDGTTEALLDTQQTDVQSPLTFASDYTTMEMFQQLMPQDTAINSRLTAAIEDEPEDLTLLKSTRFDYIRQFSTSPPSDSEHMSTVL